MSLVLPESERGKRINTDQRTGPVNVRDIVETGQSSLVHT